MPTARHSEPLIPHDHAEAIALFRAEIIGAIARRDLDHGELAIELRSLSQRRYRPPDADATRRYAVPTLERWLYAYKAGGLAALRPMPRSDKGRAQALTHAQRELLADIRREHPNASVPLILRTLVADGRLDKGAISEATVRRFLVDRKLDRVSLRQSLSNTTRLRWQAERPGALWHGDVCHGLPIVIGGVSRPLRIHALLDDNSRFIVAIEVINVNYFCRLATISFAGEGQGNDSSTYTGCLKTMWLGSCRWCSCRSVLRCFDRLVGAEGGGMTVVLRTATGTASPFPVDSPKKRACPQESPRRLRAVSGVF